MKNVIISALSAYIFYSFCEVRSLLIPFCVFFLFLALVAEIDESISDYRRKVRKGQRLNKIIDQMKGVRF